MAICGYPVTYRTDTVADQTNGFFGLVDARGSEENNGIVENNAAGFDLVGFDQGLIGAGLDPAQVVFFFSVPGIKALVALVISIHNAGLSRREDFVYEGAFIAFAIGKEYLARDRTIDVKSKMDLGFFGAVPIVGPVHGETGIDQRSVNSYQIPEFGVRTGQDFGSFGLEPLEEI